MSPQSRLVADIVLIIVSTVRDRRGQASFSCS